MAGLLYEVAIRVTTVYATKLASGTSPVYDLATFQDLQQYTISEDKELRL